MLPFSILIILVGVGVPEFCLIVSSPTLISSTVQCMYLIHVQCTCAETL